MYTLGNTHNLPYHHKHDFPLNGDIDRIHLSY
jgi:hypothetical protein